MAQGKNLSVYEHIGICGEWMPEDAIEVNWYFRYKSLDAKLKPFLGIAALGKGAEEMIFLRYPHRLVKLADLK